MTAASMSMKPLERGIPLTMDRPKKLNSHRTVNIRMIASSKGASINQSATTLKRSRVPARLTLLQNEVEI